MTPEKPVQGRSPPNRLIHEQSPYLLQHADNPVDWHPWGEEAFAKARKEDKPVFLSIGYSACHWCHVMEKESFADPVVAKLLNDVFVCIKVDREERPDIDQIYMAAAHVLAGSGGWPLTILMTPDKKPFFAASYIPKESRYGMTGLLDLIPRISKVWRDRRGELEEAGDCVFGALQSAPSPEGDIPDAAIDEAYETFLRIFDEENGGFGDAPRFPAPHNLIFLLRYAHGTGKEPAYAMAEKTLHAMRQGGIFDQIGWGFHRYATDVAWAVPHFEKMLYDQALLAMAYTEAYLATGREEFARTARETIAYVLRDMTGPGGGFYSAEDADSEGEEGKFYTWTKAEILDVLGEDGERFSRIFGIADRPGRQVLRRRRPLASWAHEFSMPEEDLAWFVEGARQRLFQAREQRVRPAKDDKILTDTNALMIAALAGAARAFDDPGYLAAAEKALAFVLENLRDEDGRLLHCRGVAATLDDYAFILRALIEVYEASFSPAYIRTAVDLARDMIARYLDRGGFFFTPDDTDLPVRQKTVYDGAVPSGNGVAMHALFVLGRMTANLELEAVADGVLRAFAGAVRKAPAAAPGLLTGLLFMRGPGFEVIIAGVPGAEDTRALVGAVRSRYTPEAVVIFRPSDEEEPDITRVAGFTRDVVAIGGKATAYVCINYACDIPTTEPAEMLRLLASRERPPEPVI